ncbi:methyltransferase domain-containing protein (plasmid) [Aneurinibacillus sp. Ricciae_BoGa-3]|uniref:methyltransferase domain-containing protein n=1 Tax=Aneurinibacillus sp. Ricciae_BoGa-3 TaxID=3022697 RepID=UPI0023417F32|nr:methyltransferase domain-containing protein [Aneurinibacillus sp. Ricciae_BoGa-3]WCK57709.1 methyltransferase domain-containing protein [Aneurinibacillus sp. Ricciae_BoGa-3]
MKRIASWAFDKNVSDVFDTHVRQSVPLYDALQEVVLHLSDFFIKQNDVIYDLGCATGETIHKISHRHFDKNLRFIGIDESQAMLQKANEKNLILNNVEFIQHAIENYVFEHKSNFILSILTIQFLPIHERESVLRNVYQTLNKGGAFLFVEKTFPFETQTHDIFTKIYHDYKEEHGLSTQEIREKDKSLRGVMQSLSVQENVEILRHTGFEKVDIFFKYLNFTGFLAIK